MIKKNLQTIYTDYLLERQKEKEREERTEREAKTKPMYPRKEARERFKRKGDSQVIYMGMEFVNHCQKGYGVLLVDMYWLGSDGILNVEYLDPNDKRLKK